MANNSSEKGCALFHHILPKDPEARREALIKLGLLPGDEDKAVETILAELGYTPDGILNVRGQIAYPTSQFSSLTNRIYFYPNFPHEKANLIAGSDSGVFKELRSFLSQGEAAVGDAFCEFSVSKLNAPPQDRDFRVREFSKDGGLSPNLAFALDGLNLGFYSEGDSWRIIDSTGGNRRVFASIV